MQISTLTTQFGPGPLSQLSATHALQNADNTIFYLQLGLTVTTIVLIVMTVNKVSVIQKMQNEEKYPPSRYKE